MLGESFEDTEKQTIIHLKKDVKWSDGTPFTSKKHVLCTYYLGFIRNWVMWKYVDKIEAPDDYTVKINLERRQRFDGSHCIFQPGPGALSHLRNGLIR